MVFGFANYIPAIGTAVCVGIVGATVGGGVSSAQGIYGLLIDTLKSVRMITASGEAITVSPYQNADLFWGLRGAGASYGVITSATYGIFDSTDNGQVLVADFEFYGGSNGSIWEILKTFDKSLPARLALNIGIQYLADSKQVSLILFHSITLVFKDLNANKPRYSKQNPRILIFSCRKDLRVATTLLEYFGNSETSTKAVLITNLLY